ncbi:MAG: UV DNA damage repair endonuclease UvsE [Erysipelotrichaceae bacterium]|nr:UV DNA damage repair endonuclease UvsE [Erysipelotrichaceae bacterium]
MNIGYACLTIGVLDTTMKKCLLKNANHDTLLSVIKNNLRSLENMLIYNSENNIHMFRISSDLIPFGSDKKVNQIDWINHFATELDNLKNLIKKNNIRISMHPGQYTVLNAQDKNIVDRAIADLEYHSLVLSALGTDNSCKIILHIGGIYNDKEAAMNRFIDNFNTLSTDVKNRLVIENDDRSYNISDVLTISQRTNIPVVYDNLHNELNPFDRTLSDEYWIKQCSTTWRKQDGKQKIHYSQKNQNKKQGSHSNTININEFLRFYKSIASIDLDIMLEVKDKNISAVKCINSLYRPVSKKLFEKEWSRYKYVILSNSHNDYLKIRELLKDFKDEDALVFYDVIENNLNLSEDVGNQVNAAQHIWGYFKEISDIKERKKFFKLLDDYQNQLKPIKSIKNYLYKLTIKYDIKYLLTSHYFYL